MDRSKESLFNILSHKIEWNETDVLDLFAGTGNISLEAASRGAKSVLAVDQHPECIKFIQKSADKLDFPALKTICADVLSWQKNIQQSYSLIFLDPPYLLPGQKVLVESLFSGIALKTGGWMILEHLSHLDYSDLQGFIETRKYGQSAFSFFYKN